jgi:RNA polymerase sigma-70 factor, ECF subfamily
VTACHASDPGPEAGSISRRTAASDAESARLMSLMYDELRALARRWFRRQPKDHTLQPTALVHETYLRLSRIANPQWRDRAHFFAVASTVMRRILVDHARQRQSSRRGGRQASRVSLDAAAMDGHAPPTIDILDLDAALNRLAALNERQSRIVEMRFLGGLTIEETADVLGVSPRTVKLDWTMARAWLLDQLNKGAET